MTGSVAGQRSLSETQVEDDVLHAETPILAKRRSCACGSTLCRKRFEARCSHGASCSGREGQRLDYPYTSQIEGKLREARLRVGKTRYRILYFFDEDRTAILLHGFTKATAAVEESDKKIGRARMASHEARLAARTGQKTASRTPAKENKRR